MQSQTSLSPIDKIKAAASNSPLSRPGTPSNKSPYLNNYKTRSSSEDESGAADGSQSSLKAPGFHARNVDAFLISPYASTSQVTVSVSDVPHTAPIEGSTVRLVSDEPLPGQVRHSRATSASADSIPKRSGDLSRSASPVDEVIAAYLTNGGTEEAAKARRRMHQIVQSSEPYVEKPREPQMSWTLTMVLLVFVTVVSVVYNPF